MIFEKNIVEVVCGHYNWNGCIIKIINQTIQRNIMRFPESFCFQLPMEQVINLKSQSVTSSSRNEIVHGGLEWI